ncbi:MAG: helical backbone metal receptor [Acidobacteriia bacterium]|nr:helical backbone metal receptor [Terriglobia bacterium]
MSPALTEILFALGLGDRVVGVTKYCDWPPEARRLPKIGGFVDPSVEAVVALSPDLALVSPAAGNREAALAIRRLGIRLEVVPCETLAEAYDAIQRVASVCGVQARGRALSGALRARIEATAARVRRDTPVPTLFCVQLEPLVAAGTGTLPSEILELAGGRNIVREPRYPRIGIESVLAAGPEAIIVARMDSQDAGGPGRVLDFWKRWSSIPAVGNERVFVIDATTALRAGPRVAEAVEGLAALLHPRIEPRSAGGGKS